MTTRRRWRRSLRASRGLAAFGITAATLVAVAAAGGAYDVAVRQELAMLVWAALAAGLLSGVLPRARLTAAVRWAAVGLGLLLALTAASLTWTESAERTVPEIARILHVVGILLLVALAVDKSTVVPVLGGGLTAGAIVCGLALASRLVPGAFPSQHSSGVFSPSRLSYPLGYYNAVAAWSTLTIALALCLSAHMERTWTRAAALAVAPLAGLVLFLTYSRAGIVGAACAVMLTVVVARNRWTALAHAILAAAATAPVILLAREHRSIADATGTAGADLVAATLAAAMAVCAALAASSWSHRLDSSRVRNRYLQLGAICAIVLVAAATLPGLADRAWTSFTAPKEATSGDPVQRLGDLGGNRDEIWAAAIDAFEAHPLRGTGAGTFEFWFNRNGGETSLKDAHSLLLEPLAELGILGPIGVIVFLSALLTGGWRRLRSAPASVEAGAGAAGVVTIVVFTLHAGVDWTWECTAVTALAVVAATAAASGTSEFRRPAALGPRLAGTAAALGVVALMVPGISSQLLLRDSRAAAAAGDMALALRKADAAAGAEPWSSTPLVQRALVLEQLGRLRQARATMAAAASREPTNWRHPYIAARIEAELGSAERALAQLERARRLRPLGRFLQPPRAESAPGSP